MDNVLVVMLKVNRRPFVTNDPAGTGSKLLSGIEQEKCSDGEINLLCKSAWKFVPETITFLWLVTFTSFQNIANKLKKDILYEKYVKFSFTFILILFIWVHPLQAVVSLF